MNSSISLTFLFYIYAADHVPRSIDTTMDDEVRRRVAAIYREETPCGESSVSTHQGGKKSKATEDSSSQFSPLSIPRTLPSICPSTLRPGSSLVGSGSSTSSLPKFSSFSLLPTTTSRPPTTTSPRAVWVDFSSIPIAGMTILLEMLRIVSYFQSTTSHDGLQEIFQLSFKDSIVVFASILAQVC